MRQVSISVWTWRIGEPTWRDPYAPAPDPDQLALIDAATSAGWYGLTSFLDQGGLRCVAANGQEIAVVTLAGCTFEEAAGVAGGCKSIDAWSIAGFCRLLRGQESLPTSEMKVH